MTRRPQPLPSRERSAKNSRKGRSPRSGFTLCSRTGALTVEAAKGEKLVAYEIRVKGHLDESWSEWFDGLTITNLESGETVLRGEIVDQAALHGVLSKVRDLNLPLIAVSSAGPERQDPAIRSTEHLPKRERRRAWTLLQQR